MKNKNKLIQDSRTTSYKKASNQISKENVKCRKKRLMKSSRFKGSWKTQLKQKNIPFIIMNRKNKFRKRLVKRQNQDKKGKLMAKIH